MIRFKNFLLVILKDFFWGFLKEDLFYFFSKIIFQKFLLSLYSYYVCYSTGSSTLFCWVCTTIFTKILPFITFHSPQIYIRAEPLFNHGIHHKIFSSRIRTTVRRWPVLLSDALMKHTPRLDSHLNFLFLSFSIFAC